MDAPAIQAPAIPTRAWDPHSDGAAVRTVLRDQDLVAHRTSAKNDTLEHAAERLVSQTFFGTILRQMRSSPFKSELFSGGRGGEVFAALYDQHLADRMARGAGRSLAASIVRHLQRSRPDLT